MILVEEAQQIILRHIAPLPAEELPLLQGIGRVANEEVP
jgi:molybdopterin biosynthesis enzyme